MLTFGLTVPVCDKTPIEKLAADFLGVKSVDKCTIVKRSLDARRKDRIVYIYRVAVALPNEHKYVNKKVTYYDMNIPTVEHMTKGRKIDCRPVVVGSGPCGMFAALTLAYLGARPIVIERGDDVDARKAKTEEFVSSLRLDTESNVQFGEGGAGTFSDGKLNTGVNNEFVSAVINEFVLCGAPEEISYAAKPHIGTDLLIDVVKNLRKKIISLGGEFRFRTKLTDIETAAGRVVAAVTDKGRIPCDRIYLAIGHSARDTFEMLYRKSVKMVSKIFSMGVRIEHLSETINRAQYGESARFLPAADYKTAVDTGEYGALYTFCMCPGGKVINASSEEGGVCVNGMSEHARDGKNSNSALLINVSADDWKTEHPLGGMEFQRKYERKTYAHSGGYKPVSQTVGDFLSGKSGGGFGEVKPSVGTGYVIGDLRECLPERVVSGISTGIPLMGRKLKGFDSPQAVLTGIEARSSSPVRILRDEKCVSSIIGLYPLGEGAGYAGGITSAAADGIRGVLADAD